MLVLVALAWGACPAAPACGACPAHLEERMPAKGLVVVGNQNMRCSLAGMATLASAGCADCAALVEYPFPFDYASCDAGEAVEACEAWAWLKCAFPDDDGMHSYFLLDGAFLGTGFQVQRRGASAIGQALRAAEVSVSDAPCADAYPDAHLVVQAEFAMAEANGVVLFGWDGCPCTGIAQARFASMDACYEELTWSNPDADIMSYLQCVEGDASHHSFIYTRENLPVAASAASAPETRWVFRGNGFQLDPAALPERDLQAWLVAADYKQGCRDVFAVNVYGETLSECRASVADGSGSWMWDGKCTEEGGGVHQICMDQLPADFSVLTGQSAWSEGRANARHCVCVGAWSLYMTREDDPEWTTTEAWPFCSAIPASALTSRYLGKWKSWNGIPANIVHGVRRLVEKCYLHTQGPGSAAPAPAGKCALLAAFRELQRLEPSLEDVSLDEVTGGESLDCEEVVAVRAEARDAARAAPAGPEVTSAALAALALALQ